LMVLISTWFSLRLEFGVFPHYGRILMILSSSKVDKNYSLFRTKKNEPRHKESRVGRGSGNSSVERLAPGNEPLHHPGGVCQQLPADCSLLLFERETGLEPATSSLGSWHSTTELLPQWTQYRQNLPIVQGWFARHSQSQFAKLSYILIVHNVDAKDSLPFDAQIPRNMFLPCTTNP
jgi:hypothetical protein